MSESHELVVTWTSPDRPGLVHAVTGACAQVGGNLTECQQFTSTDTGNFFIRLQVESASSPESATLLSTSTSWGVPSVPSSWPPKRPIVCLTCCLTGTLVGCQSTLSRSWRIILTSPT